MATLNWNSAGRQVWAFYHPFYGNPEGPTKRWLMWNEPVYLATGYPKKGTDIPDELKPHLQHNPDKFIGPNRRDNYSVFYPKLGLYDSLDPKVLEQHVRWALEAEIDGFLWSCTVPSGEVVNQHITETHFFKSLKVMVSVLERMKVNFKISPDYDSYCWWNYPVERIIEEITALVKNFGDSPHILRIDGKVCIFTYSTFAKHTVSDWEKIIEGLKANGVEPLYIIAGEAFTPWVDGPDINLSGLFDGLCFYNAPKLMEYTKDGYRKVNLHLAEVARKNNLFFCASVSPGFDGRVWHVPGRVATRGTGKLYEDIWEASLECNPPLVLICSWNEWGEGTQIEPAEEYGDLYLQLTRKWTNHFKSM